MPQRHDECGLTVFLLFRKPDLTSRISQKSGSPHSKVIIIKLVHKHGYSSFVICCHTLYSYFENLSIAFPKVFDENAAEILLPAAPIYDSFFSFAVFAMTIKVIP